MAELLQHGLNALILGGTYALLGIGLTLIFGIMRVVNFTHGELYSFGAYMMFMFVMLLHLDFFVSLILAMALGVALGALIELVLLRKLRARRYRHDDARDDRRLDRHAKSRAICLVGRGEVGQHALPVRAPRHRRGVGLVEPALRLRGRAPPDRS